MGKQAEDNDELSMSPEHRAGSDWWMHASGCPGSHVVIRRSDEPLDNEIVQDAAADEVAEVIKHLGIGNRDTAAIVEPAAKVADLSLLHALP